jgi:inner membrane protein YidH
VSTDPESVDATRRTRLANERTLLAWLRSALTCVAVAIAVAKIVPGVADSPRWPFEILGVGFALLAAVLAVVGAQRFVSVERALDAGEFSGISSRVVALLVGLVVALTLLALGLIFVR